jgi:hypothetical protein
MPSSSFDECCLAHEAGYLDGVDLEFSRCQWRKGSIARDYYEAAWEKGVLENARQLFQEKQRRRQQSGLEGPGEPLEHPYWLAGQEHLQRP